MQEHHCQLGFIGHAHPKGFFEVSVNPFQAFHLQKTQNGKIPAIIGCPPVTRHHRRSGFCIFDSDKLQIKAYR